MKELWIIIEKTDFPSFVEEAMKVPGRQDMRPVIEKELLHYDILFALDEEGLLDHLTFHGGTSLRLCYGSDRFSEDLDFAGGVNFVSSQLLAMKECIKHYISHRYQLEVIVKEPAELRNKPTYTGAKWIHGKWLSSQHRNVKIILSNVLKLKWLIFLLIRVNHGLCRCIIIFFQMVIVIPSL
jgi:hypothetical protein